MLKQTKNTPVLLIDVHFEIREPTELFLPVGAGRWLRVVVVMFIGPCLRCRLASNSSLTSPGDSCGDRSPAAAAASTAVTSSPSSEATAAASNVDDSTQQDIN